MPNSWTVVESLGQSLWYDNLSRHVIFGGKLQQMIDDLALRGITSNPSIFQKSISESSDYDADIQECIADQNTTNEIYEKLTTDDVRSAADVMRPVYDRTNGVDGYVSIEVEPRLARNMTDTIAAARRLWATVDRPNVMIKIPGTPECIPAIRQCLAEGINVNITLLFGLENYKNVVHAFLQAMRDRSGRGKVVTTMASVASFFLSRVDTNVDKKLDDLIAAGQGDVTELQSLKGLAATANAKLAYEHYLAVFHADEYTPLQKAGVRPQRCLWASVSTKDPAYSDIKYIAPLIGPETVTTVPDETIDAFTDHGRAENTLVTGMMEAHTIIERLRNVGIDTEQVAEELQAEGVKKFADAFDTLISNIDTKRNTLQPTK